MKRLRLTKLQVAIIAVGPLSLAIVLAFSSNGSTDQFSAGPLGSEGVVEESILSVDDTILQDVQLGKTLYIVYEIYQRHGAKADMIQANTSALPERRRVQTAMTFDAQGLLAQERALAIDENDSVVQERFIQDGNHMVKNERTGEITRLSSVDGRAFTVNKVSQLNGAALVNSMQSDGSGWRTIGSGSIQGVDTTVLERRVPWVDPYAGRPDNSGFRIPWTSDLSPTYWIYEFEVSLGNPFIHDERTYVVDADDVRTLVAQRRIIGMAIQD